MNTFKIANIIIDVFFNLFCYALFYLGIFASGFSFMYSCINGNIDDIFISLFWIIFSIFILIVTYSPKTQVNKS